MASAFSRGHPCPRVLDFVLTAHQTSPRATTSDRVTIMLSPLRGDRARDIVARPPFFMRNCIEHLPLEHVQSTSVARNSSGFDLLSLHRAHVETWG